MSADVLGRRVISIRDGRVIGGEWRGWQVSVYELALTVRSETLVWRLRDRLGAPFGGRDAFRRAAAHAADCSRRMGLEFVSEIRNGRPASPLDIARAR